MLAYTLSGDLLQFTGTSHSPYPWEMINETRNTIETAAESDRTDIRTLDGHESWEGGLLSPGGGYMTVSGPDLGERVIDSEDDTPSVAEVVEAPGTLAREHTIPAMGKTVAQANPEYPADDRVIRIRFVRDGKPSGPTYHYLASRLEQVGADWEPSDAARKSDGRRERERIFSGHAEAIETYVSIARHLLIRQETAALDTIYKITLDDGATDYVANAEAVFDGMLAPGSGPDPIPGPEMKNVETRGECSNAREDEYRPNVPGAICCWECSDQPNNRPEKYHDDDAGPKCMAVGTSLWDRNRKLRQKLAE